MTKQEAIEILNWIPTKGDEVDAMEMAIEALKEQEKLRGAVALLEVLLVESLKQLED